MHALGRYLLEQMDRQRMTRTELIRRSGLSKQTIYNLLNDPRAHMDQTPQRKTIEKLASALGVPEGDVLLASAAAIGVPVVANIAPLASASDAQLLEELRARLASTAKERDGDADAAPITHAGESPATDQERRERSDAPSTSARSLRGASGDQVAGGDSDGDELARRRRGRTPGEVVPFPMDEMPMPDESLMAGYDAPSEGRALREQQDADAEGPQATPEGE